MKNLKAALLVCVLTCSVHAQEPTERERALLEQIQRLEARVEALEKRLDTAPASATTSTATASTTATTSSAITQTAPVPKPDVAPGPATAPVNYGMTFDGYYAYNFNHPASRLSALRAYDVSSNSFSLNQATFLIEKPVDLNVNRRWGVRVDLQYGQATQTLQGNPANEPRPDIYRALFQAYGTYVAPIGTGLTVDFGKFSSALGIEGNYTKDQLNYSRSYLFDFLPFYHFGFRSNYNFNPKVNLTWWLVNGIQQSEDFNGFKSNAFLLNVKPAKALSWNLNYYFGEEGRSTAAAAPPHGKTHIVDSYLSWNAAKNTTLALEGDYVVARVNPSSVPSHVSAGAVYLRQQLRNGYAIAARAEYLSDRGGLFSSANQALKEATLTFERKLAEGLLIRTEWRRDFSNVPYFATQNPNVLRKAQSTATLGMIWWFGNKEGSW